MEKSKKSIKNLKQTKEVIAKILKTKKEIKSVSTVSEKKKEISLAGLTKEVKNLIAVDKKNSDDKRIVEKEVKEKTVSEIKKLQEGIKEEDVAEEDAVVNSALGSVTDFSQVAFSQNANFRVKPLESGEVFSDAASNNLEGSMFGVQTEKKNEDAQEKSVDRGYQENLYSEARGMYEGGGQRRINVGREAMAVSVRHEGVALKQDALGVMGRGKSVHMADLGRGGSSVGEGYVAYHVEMRREGENQKMPWEQKEEKIQRYKQ